MMWNQSMDLDDDHTDAGSDELEMLEFTIAGNHYGINVAKVREIIQYCPVQPMQNAHPAVEGICKPRDQVLTVLNLAHYLGLPPSDAPQRDILILTAFNQTVFAFHVHGVTGIDRVSWSHIQKPDSIIYGGGAGVATGIAQYEDRLITLLDFEKIITELSPQDGIQPDDIYRLGPRERSLKPILVVEDSVLLSKMILESLSRAGYVNTAHMDNGRDAWSFLKSIADSGDAESQVACVVTDIEMPLMDGHHLLKLIKSDPATSSIPVVLFSSLIDEEMELKGIQLQADAQLSKPQITDLVLTLDRLVSGKGPDVT